MRFSITPILMILMKFVFFIFRGSFGAAKFLMRMLAQSNFKEDFFLKFGQKIFFSQKLLRPFVSVKRDFYKFLMF